MASVRMTYAFGMGLASPSADSLDRDGVERGPDTARDVQRRRDEHALVDAVRRAVLGERLEVEELAEEKAHVADREHVEGDHRAPGVRAEHLDGEVVGA